MAIILPGAAPTPDATSSKKGKVQLAGDLAGTAAAPTIKSSVGLTGNPTAATQSQADNSNKIATTAYVDLAILGQNFKEAVRVATTANLVGVYVAGVFTYTATGTDSIDGVTLALNDRVLVKNQTSTFQNGIYIVTTAGAIGVAGVLTRATDASASGEFKTGDSVFVIAGTTLSSTTWAYTGADNPTIGTDAITYVQVAGQGSFTAGTGIAITGTSIAIDTSVTVDKTTAQTLTNKTLTSPVVNTPTGIVKGDVGLGNVDNTSDATKNSATATLTNKRVTNRAPTVTQSATPTINTDVTDVAHITGLAQAITSMTTNLSGTPVQGDTLRIDITDNGTARAITWGASFESSGTITLPATTVLGVRLDVGFVWNTVTSKWRCVGAV